MPARPVRRGGGLIAVLLLLLVLACSKDEEQSAPTDTALGGATTRPDATNNAFGLPATNLAPGQRTTFEQGDSFFTQNWVTAPSSTISRDGLGPTLNAQACASCHVLDGRGAPPSSPDDVATRGLLARLSVPGVDEHGGPLPEPTYGGQLQDKSVQGVPAEGRLVATYSDLAGQYEDGTGYTLRKPTYSFVDLAFGPMRTDTMISPRLAPQMIGMGLLEAIPEATILAAADAEDRNGDGISGRPNYAWNPRTSKKELGRFGWKANQPTIEAQVAGAFNGDIGITSSLVPNEDCPASQTVCKNAPNGGNPEIDDQRLAAVTFYSRVLAIPAMRDAKDKQVGKGAKQFMAMGCATCHTPTVTTGSHEIPAVSNQTIHPYTDLLLHDMGAELADGRPDFDANGQEWRTPPLWGLGLSEDVSRHMFLMHDGRARSFAEAILWHGGEGAAAQERFRLASPSERAALIRYLESL